MAKTWVFWDINSCPVPKDYYARLVGSSIESALKKAGYCEGDLTITAIGNLNHILQLNPIRLCHTPPGSEEMRPSDIDQSLREFSCKLCSADGHTFGDFTTHLKSKNHLERVRQFHYFV
uniref:U1-type domain-containing protein n=1 Tax=Brassica oleracea TaxID=3712 RepID=A0A3P6DM02_BRAOL|nr:unnamed protein product [Brassica oleracea]